MLSLPFTDKEKIVFVRGDGRCFSDTLDLVGLEGFRLDKGLRKGLVDATVAVTVAIIGPV